MDEIISRCGNELHGIEYWLHHHGDPRQNASLIQEMTSMLQSVNQILMTSYISNQQLVREVKAESGRSMVAAANRIASNHASAAA